MKDICVIDAVVLFCLAVSYVLMSVGPGTEQWQWQLYSAAVWFLLLFEMRTSQRLRK